MKKIRTIIESCKPIIAPAMILIAAYLLLAVALWCLLFALRDQRVQESILPGLCSLISLIAMVKSANQIVVIRENQRRRKNERELETRQHNYKVIGGFLEKLVDEVPTKFVAGVMAAGVITTQGNKTTLSNLFLNVKMSEKKRLALLLSVIKLIHEFGFEPAHKDSLLNDIAWKLVNGCNRQDNPQEAHKGLLEGLEKKGVFEVMKPYLEEVGQLVENGWNRRLVNIGGLVESLQ